MRTTFIFTLIATSLSASAFAAAPVCEFRNTYTGLLAWGRTDWRVAASVDTLEGCIAVSQAEVGKDVQFRDRPGTVVSGDFRFSDGTRVITGTVHAPGRRGD